MLGKTWKNNLLVDDLFGKTWNNFGFPFDSRQDQVFQTLPAGDIRTLGATHPAGAATSPVHRATFFFWGGNGYGSNMNQFFLLVFIAPLDKNPGSERTLLLNYYV